MCKFKFRFFGTLLALLTVSAYSAEVRIKDIVDIKGNRTNHVQGIGLVVGLAGTGDSPASLTTNKLVANLITRMGIATSPQGVVTQSLAAVVVTGELKAFARNGSRVDIKVSVIGDAKNLAGGTLLPTRLIAGDGQVYVIASGQILIGQANGVGAKTLTVAAIPEGGMVEREFTPDLVGKSGLSLTLKDPDFTSNARIAEAINRHFKGYYASSLDSTGVVVKVPRLFVGKLVDFISQLESLTITKDVEAVVVINERTGTIVMGAGVSIEPVVVSHGDLTIRIGEGENVKDQSLAPVSGSTVGQLIESLNALGIKPADLVGIMQAVHASGSLNAKLRIM